MEQSRWLGPGASIFRILGWVWAVLTALALLVILFASISGSPPLGSWLVFLVVFILTLLWGGIQALTFFVLSDSANLVLDLDRRTKELSAAKE